MTRSFVIVGQKAVASDEFLLDDLPGTSGRIDVLVRCLRATLLSSHGLRRDCIAYLVLLGGPRAPRVLRVDGATAQFIRPDERALGGMVKKVLATHDDDDREGFVLVKPGVAVARGGIDAVLADVAGAAIYVLAEDAPDIRAEPIDPASDVVFVAGDHIGLPDDVRARLDAAGARPVSLGPISVHADDAVAIAMNELDRRAILPTGQ
jgi:tRNA (pseudouridine54-N1)-methyltransferase